MEDVLANHKALAASVLESIELRAESYTELADRIWGFAEVGFHEKQSADAQMSLLAKEGFAIRTGIGGIPTAFVAEVGEGGPVVGILGEFDALAGMSQIAGLVKPAVQSAGEPGHGCGHNLLGAGSALAAAALAQTLRVQGIKGRVRYYGCPAEEGGGGKAFMARAGAFDDLDAAFTWHPSSITAVNYAENLAFLQAVFTFEGKASHAGISPHLGRSALDAAELMNVGANFLREHVIPEARIHYAFRDAGGKAANVVQASSTLVYIVRAPNLPLLSPIYERIKKIAEGAAIMTETTVTMSIESGMSNILLNRTLTDVLYHQLKALGPPDFDEQDKAAAKSFTDTLSQDDLVVAAHHVGADQSALNEPLHGGLVPFEGAVQKSGGSTDVGDVSWITPTAQFWGASFAIGTGFHTWQLVAQGKLGAAHKGMVQAARVLALAALQTLCEPDLLSRARQEFEERRGLTSYRCPIPADVRPPLT